MSIPLSIAFYALGFLVATIPPILMVRRARRLRRLSEARLRLSKCIVKMNGKLISQEIKSSQLCHNQVYHLMLSVQRMTSYPVPKFRWLIKSDENEFKEALKNELLDSSPELSELVLEFINSYYQMVRSRHPWKTRAANVEFLINLTLLRCTRWSLKKVLSYLQHREEQHANRRREIATRMMGFAYQEIRSGRVERHEDALLTI